MRQLLWQLWGIILKILNLLLDRLLKPLWIVLFLLIFIFCKNWYGLVKFFSKLNIQQFVLIKDYISTFTAWPILAFIISLIFIYKFSDSIKKFLGSHGLSKIGPLYFEKNEENVPQTDRNVKSEEDVRGKEEKDSSEAYEFYFLNTSALVWNTKNALNWIYNQPSHSTTKENFIKNFQLPMAILNQTLEKETEMAALKKYGLLEEKENKINVTTKGERFLKATNFLY